MVQPTLTPFLPKKEKANGTAVVIAPGGPFRFPFRPFFAQKGLRQKNAALGIVTEAWSLIGGVKRYWPGGSDAGGGDPLVDPAITGIGQAHGKTAAQVILRWHLQNGVVAIPRSVTPTRIAANIDIFDFVLSDSEMVKIDALDTGVRGGPDPTQVDTDSFSEYS